MKTLKKYCSFSTNVLFQNKKFSIETYINCHTNLTNIVVVKDQTFTDFPIYYSNTKSIGFDFPEKLPEYIKKRVRSYYNEIRK